MRNDNVESTASFLDKTDWRKTIHRKLEACVDARGTWYYPIAVDKLVHAVSAEYPGFNADKAITDKYDVLKNKYDKAWDKWLSLNSTKRKWQKWKMKRYLYNMFCDDVNYYIMNLCARKRMLLWGSKKIPGGTQMPYEE